MECYLLRYKSLQRGHCFLVCREAVEAGKRYYADKSEERSAN